MRAARRATAMGAVLAVVLAAPRAPADEPGLHEALDRSYAWLQAHPPDPGRSPLGFVCLDAWTWLLFATWHPDARRRAEAGAHADRRLRALRPPPAWTAVALSYWALALAAMDLRGLPLHEARAALRDVDLDAVLAATDPTTRWWTAALLRPLGVAAGADVGATFLGAHAGATPGRLTPADAYAVFHEIVPAARLGHGPLRGLTPAHVAFATAVLPRLVEGARAAGDTDATAEALAALALLGGRETPAYRDGLAWMLSQRNSDGTYRSARDANRRLTVDGYRHVVLVASFALLTALERFEPVVPRR